MNIFATTAIVAAVGSLTCAIPAAHAGEKFQIKGKSTGVAVASKFTDPKSGEEKVSTEKQVKQQNDYVKRYDGDVLLQAEYTLVFKDDKSVDPTKSSITFDTISFTDFKKEVKSPFKTSPVPIVEVVLKGGDTTMVESFKFEGNDWYDPKSGSFNAIINKGIKGSIDFKAGTTTHEASYIFKGNATSSTFTVAGTIVPVGPAPGPLDDGLVHLWSPVPEPGTWAMLLGGLGALALCARPARGERRLRSPVTA
jgi:hypothetical protein